MQEKLIHIPNINCSHCAAAITRELEEMDGVASVTVDAAAKTAIIRWLDPLSWDQIRLTLEDIGYPPEE
jgi:copper chaperone CopZ